MALSTSLTSKAHMVEKTINLGTATATVVGPALGAGTLVLATGVTLVDATENITTFNVTVKTGSTTLMASTSVDNGSVGDIKFGAQTKTVVSADTTIDVATVISGTTAGSRARVWALVVDVNEATKDAAEVSRDVLA